MTQTYDFSLYNASAGSGKTYTLVIEYLKIILLSKKPDAYRNILAITFTNKAVHEMKSRVVDTLYQLSTQDADEKSLQIAQTISQDTGLSLQKIHLKAKEIIKSLIHNYAAFDISTIDKFTHKVIRSFAHDLNLPITFEVSLEADNLLAEAIDSLIAKAGEDKLLTKLLVDYAMEKTDDDKSWDISHEIFDIGKLLQNENNREEIKHFDAIDIAEFGQIKQKISLLCKTLEQEMTRFGTTALSLINDNGIDENSFPYQTFPKHLRYIITNDDRANNHKFIAFEDIKIKVKSKDEQAILGLIPDFLALLQQVYSGLEKINFYTAILRNITPLSLLNTIADELTDVQKKQNVLSISEFNKLINEQIKNQPAPFIYERLGEKYRHFFIDEFQDTSEMQWQNLIPLIDNALSSQNEQGIKGSLLIVGDPKQSIYRWRGGKAEQFIALEKGKIPFSNPSFKAFPLEKNYRSFSKIIEFNNDFFKFISNKFTNQDYNDLYQNKSAQLINNKIGGYVNITFLPKLENDALLEDDFDKNQKQLEATLQTIKNIETEGFLYNDIVVLVRKNSQGVLLANYLIEQQIPIISSESLLLVNATDVQTVIYFLEYINNANNREAKVNILYAIAIKTVDLIAVHEFIAKGMALEDELLFESFLASNAIEISFKNCRKKSLYEVVETVIQLIITNKNSAYIQYFQDLILEHELKKQSGLLAFLNYWQSNAHRFSIPLPSSNNAVKIMTIHKSKGLEFPVVIMPFANQNYSKSVPEKIWLEADKDQTGLSKALVNKNSSVEQFGAENASHYLQKKEEDTLDAVNVLYVALTRAEEQLYILSEEETPNKNGDLPNTLAAYFISFLETKNFKIEEKTYHYGSSKRISVAKEHIETTIEIPVIKAEIEPQKIKIAQKESLMWNTARQQAIEYGNTIHEIMAFINTANDVDFALQKALQMDILNEQQLPAIKQTILEIVNHKELTDYFSEEHKVLNEQTIIQKQGNVVKPDRMSISKDKKVFLLDYKTGLHLPKHKTQLENYQKIIEDMGYKVEKKSLVYIGAEIEIVNL